MAKSLSVATVLEKNRLASDTPFLIALDINVIDPVTGALVETGRYVRNTEPITWNGFTYEASNFDIELREEAGSMQTVNLSFKDYTRTIQQRMQLYGGGIGFGVVISVINAGNLAQGAEVQEFFQVTGAESANYEVSFTLGAENAVARTFPRRRQTRDFCRWRYKGLECRYAGALPSCDLTLKGPNGCQAHDNVIRFGGYPGMNTRDVQRG